MQRYRKIAGKVAVSGLLPPVVVYLIVCALLGR